jgi:molybdopterin-guanine dinucleotide biosynthesis protein A
MVNPEAVSVLILAGGRSRRMGRDKAWLDLNGQPLVAHVAQRALPLADEVIFSTAEPDRFGELALSLGVPVQVVTDEHPGAGPLAGIEAGLKAACHELVLAVATDMPFLSVPLLRFMLSRADGYDAVVPVLPLPTTGELLPEPLHAFYWRTCLVAITGCLQAGRRQTSGFLAGVRCKYVSQNEIRRFDPTGMSFFNINTPEDWLRGLELAGHAQPATG